MQGFQNVDATVKYCRTIDHIFDFLNSRNSFGKGVKSPITSSNISNLESVIIPLVNYLFTLKVKNKNNTVSYIYQTAKKSFVIGFAVAIKSLFSIGKLIFNQNPLNKYILTYKFSQEHIEILFARFRQRFGANNNPNVLKFKVALKQILLNNAIKCNKKMVTVTVLMMMFLGHCLSLNGIKKKKDNKGELNFETIDEINQETLNRSILINCINSFMSEAKQSIFDYITGYVVRKISKHIDCDSCIQSLLLSQTSIEHAYPVLQLYTKLISLKNFGGLFLSSESSYKVIIEAEIRSKTEINKNKKYYFIISYVY